MTTETEIQSPTQVTKQSTSAKVTHSRQSHTGGILAQLQRLVDTSNSRDEFLVNLQQELKTFPNVVASGIMFLVSENQWSFGPHSFTGVAFEQEEVQQALQTNSTQAVEKQQAIATRLTQIRNVSVVSAPVLLTDGTTGSVTLAVLNGQETIKTQLMLVQLASTYIKMWQERERSAELDWEAAATSIILELVGKIEASTNKQEASYLLAQELQQLLKVQQAAFAWKTSKSRCRIASISGRGEFDKQSETVRVFRRAAAEAALKDELITWPAADPLSRSGCKAHQQLQEALRVESVVSLPLKVDEATVGVCMLVGAKERLLAPRTLQLLDASSRPLASVMLSVNRAEPTIWGRMFLKKATQEQKKTSWAKVSLYLTLMFISVMCWVFPHKVKCAGTAEPVVTRFTVAPFGGLLERSFVEPGDIVRKGDLLAVMEERQLGWQKAELEAKRHQAMKQHDTYLARGEIARAQLSKLEAEQFDQELKILAHRQENLEIRAPIDGVILSGQLSQVEHAPVEVGQALFEIAPLSTIRVEIAIPADDIGHVRVGLPVTVHWDGEAEPPVEGKIASIRPRSEIVDSKNVFIATAEFENTSGQLRPGMQGDVRIQSLDRPLGWILFHKPWHRLKQIWR